MKDKTISASVSWFRSGFIPSFLLAICVTALLVAGQLLSAKAEPPDPLADKNRLTRLTTGPMRQFTFAEKAAIIPEVSLTDAQGQQKTLAEWRGKSLLVNFWAPWCAACRQELPSMQHLKRLLGKQDFEVVLIDVDGEGDAGKAADFLAELGVNLPVSLFDKERKAFNGLQAIGVPTSVFIDCHGRELGRLKGSAPWDHDTAVLLVKALMRGAGCYDDERDKL